LPIGYKRTLLLLPKLVKEKGINFFLAKMKGEEGTVNTTQLVPRTEAEKSKIMAETLQSMVFGYLKKSLPEQTISVSDVIVTVKSDTSPVSGTVKCFLCLKGEFHGFKNTSSK
jgi:hypothetical protein